MAIITIFMLLFIACHFLSPLLQLEHLLQLDSGFCQVLHSRHLEGFLAHN